MYQTKGRTTVALLSRAALALALSLSACRDVVSPAPPGALIRSVVVDTAATGEIFLSVVLTKPATVEVTYWNDPAYRLRVRVPESTTEGSLVLPQLRAGRRYHFEATAVEASGARSVAENGDFDVPSLPDDLSQAVFNTKGAPSNPLTMLEVNGAFRGFVIVDAAGEPVWWWRTVGTPQGFTRRANGNFVFNDQGFGLSEVRPDGIVVHTLPTGASGARVPHHDVIPTATNTVLFLAQDPRTVADTSLVGDAIWEWNPETGAVARRWSVFDFYDPAVDVGVRSLPSDWVHANSLAIGDHGNVILSLNWLDQVVSIAPDWRSIEWKAGGRGSTYAFDADATFQGQHSAAILPNGNLLVFDNGRDRLAPARYSRGLEVSLDSRTGTAHHVWSFRTSPDTYAPYVGSARRYANGNTFVFFGLPKGFAGSATGPIGGYEVTRDGNIVWTISIANVASVYRATALTSIAGEVIVP